MIQDVSLDLTSFARYFILNSGRKLGIHLAPEKLAGASSLSFEEQATRDRLFWTAFIWDK